MSMLRTYCFTLQALCAFAGNSVLCRLALGEQAIDAGSFTSLRILSAIFVLFVLYLFSPISASESGLGYAIWYKAPAGLSITQAAVVQLSVPIIAAGGGLIFVGEMLDMHFVLSTLFILGGILLILLKPFFTRLYCSWFGYERLAFMN